MNNEVISVKIGVVPDRIFWRICDGWWFFEGIVEEILGIVPEKNSRMNCKGVLGGILEQIFRESFERFFE